MVSFDLLSNIFQPNCPPRYPTHVRPSLIHLQAGMATSKFGVLESVPIRPNPTLYRIRPILEPNSVGSK
jgi:hypothetical protein